MSRTKGLECNRHPRQASGVRTWLAKGAGQFVHAAGLVSMEKLHAVMLETDGLFRIVRSSE